MVADNGKSAVFAQHLIPVIQENGRNLLEGSKAAILASTHGVHWDGHARELEDAVLDTLRHVIVLKSTCWWRNTKALYVLRWTPLIIRTGNTK